MGEIFEIAFGLLYLGVIFVLGVFLIKDNKGWTLYTLFGCMAFVLVLSDSFYLVAKIMASTSGDNEKYASLIGTGKLIMAIAIIIFYLLLYFVWKLQYSASDVRIIEGFLYVLAIIRIVLCLLPQNQWLSQTQPILWNIICNIPFLIICILMIVLFAREIRLKRDKDFIFMPVAIFLSVLFYIPTIFWPELILLNALKLLCYAWIIWMGYNDMKKTLISVKSNI